MWQKHNEQTRTILYRVPQKQNDVTNLRTLYVLLAKNKNEKRKKKIKKQEQNRRQAIECEIYLNFVQTRCTIRLLPYL